MPMEFIDLKAQLRSIRGTIAERMQKVLDHGQYIMGPEVKELEAALAAHTGAKHCITVASGTEALLIALMALDLKPGDEVITTPFTFAATAETIVLLGGVPVLVDIEPDTCNIDAVEDRGRDHAAHPGHHAGEPVRPVRRHGRDQRHRRAPRPAGDRGRGAELRRRPTRAGAAATCPPSAAPASSRASRWAATATAAPSSPATTRWRRPRARSACTARARATTHTRVGVGGRMDTLQCAVVLAKLDRFDWEIAERIRIGRTYRYMAQRSPVFRLRSFVMIGLVSGPSLR